MINRTTDIDLSNYVENGEWQLLSITVTRNVVYYACCSVGYVVVIRLHVRHHHCTVSIQTRCARRLLVMHRTRGSVDVLVCIGAVS